MNKRIINKLLKLQEISDAAVKSLDKKIDDLYQQINTTEYSEEIFALKKIIASTELEVASNTGIIPLIRGNPDITAMILLNRDQIFYGITPPPQNRKMDITIKQLEGGLEYLKYTTSLFLPEYLLKKGYIPTLLVNNTCHLTPEKIMLISNVRQYAAYLETPFAFFRDYAPLPGKNPKEVVMQFKKYNLIKD